MVLVCKLLRSQRNEEHGQNSSVTEQRSSHLRAPSPCAIALPFPPVSSALKPWRQGRGAEAGDGEGERWAAHVGRGRALPSSGGSHDVRWWW